SFHVLAKPTGPICNLDCTYCFFLSKEALYPGDRFRMRDDVLETYLRQLLESQAGPEVTVAWQGGEPTLMGVEFFRRVVALVDELRRPGQVVHHTIQTNATLLTDEWCALLAEHRFLVGVSIDGPPAMHDAYRVDKRGGPTFAKVRQGYDLLVAHGVDVNVLTTVHAANQDHPLEVYRFLRD
ncbi:MAG: radical SAM protein, partial [Acidimicrobiales bacterium]|nr:radical SAM protein [Acidimicrobiales bacterium]